MAKKKSSLKKFAQVGLWVAGISFIVALLLLVVRLLDTLQIYSIPKMQSFNWLLAISGSLIILGLAFFALIDPQRVRQLLTGRQIKYGSNAAILLIAIIGILVVANVLVYQYQGKAIDFTEDKQNSLASESTDVLKSLPAVVNATAFFTSQSPTDSARELLEKFKQASGGKFEYTFIDPDQNPVLAKDAGITGDGKIYLQMNDRHEIVSYASEKDITSAIIRLMNPGQEVIYFLTGHGERDTENASDQSLTLAKSALTAKNYLVRTLNLKAQNQIPNDAALIVVAGPLEVITDSELSLLEQYISAGGSLIVMEEPTPLTNIGQSTDFLADYLSTTWGITLDDDIIIDTNSNQPLFAVAAAYGNHEITTKLRTLFSFFPTARSISISDTATNKPSLLVATSDIAWGETDFAKLNSGDQVTQDPQTDIMGPLTIAAAAQGENSISHLVVFGDVDFASDAFFNQYANGDLFINSVDWAVGQEELINLTSPTPITRTLNVPSNLWMLVMAISFLCVLPGIVIAAGVISWLIRRSKG